MKRISFLLVSLAMLSSCGADKTIQERCNVKGLPSGVSCYGFNEKYNKPYGKWSLDFFMKNTTGKTIEIPQVDADIYVNGKKEGPVSGGPGRALANGDSAVVSYSWICPNNVPDSLIFKFVSME